MKKRFWALLLAVMMVVSVLPTAAFAAIADEPVPSVSTPDSSPVKITKSVEADPTAANRYTLSMEAYVTGQVVTTNPVPLDIVLVLDVSGSMKDDISIVKEENVIYRQVSNTNAYVYFNWRYGDGEYWYSPDSGTTFYPVTNINWDANLGLDDYTYTYDEGNGEPKTYSSRGALLSPSNIYYKTVKTETITVSKMEALKNAVNSFIAKTAEKNAAITVDSAKHRISIVKFAGEKNTTPGNDLYYEGKYQYNNTQIVKNLTTVDSDGAAELTAAVNNLQAAGATAADWGMEFAKKALEDSERKQVVIFFTDGEPNHQNGFDTDVANTAIGHAKDLKTRGATIYTIGVFAGANPNDTQSNTNKFMHAVSSNYPGASSMRNLGDRADDSNYYKTATTDVALTEIFGKIAEDMIPDVAAGSSSVLTDTVSGWFTPVIPEDESVEAVTVEVWSARGADVEPSWAPDPNADTTEIDVKIVGPKISVTGFDYAANALAKQNGSWTGKKLVISFAIAPNADAEWEAGTNLYPTNVAGVDETNNAGLYYGNDKTVLTKSPTVRITAYSVTYDGNGGSFADGVKHEFNLLGGADMPTIATANEPTRANYSFQGWGATNKATDPVTLPATVTESVTYYAIWEKNPDQYSVTYDGNGATTGTVPTDSKSYNESDAVTVLGNTGNLDKTATVDGVEKNFVFAGWNTNADGTGTTYQANDTFTITGNTTLFAIWETDDWNETTDQPTGGDGIPDKYQAVIMYVSEEDADENPKGNVSFAQEVVTVKDEDYFRFPVAYGKIWITGSEATAADGYLFKNWTSDGNLTFEGASVAALKGQRIKGVQGGQTYTFTAHFDKAIPGLELSKTVKSIGGVAVSGSELPMAVEGDVIVWTISVKNTGNCSLKDITVTDVLKDQDGKVLSGVSVFPVGTYGNIGNELDLPFTIGDYLAAGDTAVYEARYTVTANDAGKTLINSVSAEGASMNAPGVTVKNPALSVTKTVNKTSVTVGDTVKYTITVKNTGNVDLTNVNVDEAFGGDFSKIFDLKGAEKAVTTIGFVIGELKAGETKEITFSYKTTKRETLTNSVKVTGTYEPGKTVGDEDSSAPVTVKSEPITPVGPSKPQLNYEDHYAYVVGYPDGLVHPERNITRAEVATIFFRMLLDESREYFWAQENDFSDVAETDWFNNAVSTLANAQLINGYPDGSYRPNANITRAEFATIAIRFFLDEDVEIEENNLSDVKGHWAEANINLAYALELINGYPDGTFRPDQKITRAEAMAIVNRVLKRAPEKDHLLKDMIEWPDNLNTAAWYYADVQEATNSHKFHMDKEEEYEIWTELLPVRDWVALEQEWSKANSSKNPGEVVDIKITTPEAGDNGLKLD